MLYYKKDQYQGQTAHKHIEQKTYSTRKHILQDAEVYCEQYRLAGKVDIYDSKKKLLRERKKKIHQVYDGYIFQVYGQCFALREMGYEVQRIELYSMDDNKTYLVPLPEDDKEKKDKFIALINDIRNFDLHGEDIVNPKKCINCIYNPLCDKVSC